MAELKRARAYLISDQSDHSGVTHPHLICHLFASVALLAQGCEREPRPPRMPTIVDGMTDRVDAQRPDAPRELIWSDEFEGATGARPDPRSWTYDVGGHGWGNQQLEYNTDRAENVSLNGEGQLVITARREAYQGNEYTSARIKTQGLFDVQYGRIEARIKLPTGAGIWPAFWMLGQNFDEVGWPHCGEIDIMEHRGQRPRESTGALHGPGFSAGDSLGGAATVDVDLSLDYHIYAVEWTRDGIDWFLDDERFLSVDVDDLPKGSSWPFNQPFFLILNVAVGGTYVGNPDERTALPQELTVDYVRVYAEPETR